MAPVSRPATALLLRQSGAGDKQAGTRLFELVYQELRDAVARCAKRGAPGERVQATSLVHEAVLKLAGGKPIDLRSRAQLLGLAALVMHNILVDRARRRGAAKRGGGWGRVELDPSALADAGQVDYLALDDALEKLGRISERRSQVVEKRFFGGMTLEEVAEDLGVSRRTVEGEWRAARAWLRLELEK